MILNRVSDDLEVEFGVEESDVGLGDVDFTGGLSDYSLGGDALAGLVGFSLESVVFTDAAKESGSAGGELEVFDSDVNSLGDDSVANLFVDDDSNGSGVDVEDASSPAVVVLVGHALVDGTVDNNIDDISDLVGSEGLGDVNGSVLLESLSELMSGSPLVPVAASHWLKIYIS